MAYVPTKWINTVYDSENVILQKGTPLSAENMNKIEDQLVELVELMHGHINKDILDQLKQIHIDNSHSHSNKELLDIINPANVHSHENKTVIDQVTQAHIDNSHTHGNKAVLDKVTQKHLDDIAAHTVTLNDHEQRLVDLLSKVTNLKIKVVQTIVERDALNKEDTSIVHVINASGDATVKSGWAQYIPQGTSWVKIAEGESIDIDLSWNNISGKPTVFTPAAHTHTKNEVGLSNVDNVKQASKTEFDTHATNATVHITPEERTLWNSKAAGDHVHTWTEIQGKPSVFNPAAHTHTIADVTGLQTALDGKETPEGAQTKATKAYTDAQNYTWALNGMRIVDNRNDIPIPSAYVKNRTAQEFKSRAAADLADKTTSMYVHLFTERAWTDDTGGYVHQLAFDGNFNRIWTRYGIIKTDTWSPWVELENTDGAQAKVDTHANDVVKHITQVERDKWNTTSTKVEAHTTQLSELSTHTHDYYSITNRPTIPTQTSQLSNNSGFISSNAAKITVSVTPPENPGVNDIWIVI